MWIYYKKKGHPPGSIVNSDVFTVEIVKKLFASDYHGISLTRLRINSFYWTTKEEFSEHPIFGKVFIPKTIFATNGKVDYFITLIDNKIGIRRWPGFRVKGDKKKLDHVNITAEELGMLEKCFSRVLDELGINKSIDERFNKVKGVVLKHKPLLDLISLITGKVSLAKPIAQEIFEAAADPLSYFKKNQRKLKKLDIDEPDKYMYLWLLIDRLKQLGKLGYLDWKDSVDEVNTAIASLAKNAGKQVVDKKRSYKSTLEMLKAGAQVLKRKGLVLASIDTNADAYAFIIVRKKDVVLMKSLAKKCKIKITSL